MINRTLLSFFTFCCSDFEKSYFTFSRNVSPVIHDFVDHCFRANKIKIFLKHIFKNILKLRNKVFALSVVEMIKILLKGEFAKKYILEFKN